MAELDMNTLHNQFLKELSQYSVKGNLADEEFEKAIRGSFEGATEDIAKGLFKQLIASMPSMLKEHRVLEEGFKSRNLDRWKEGFDHLRALIVCCNEIGDASRNDLVKSETWQKSAKMNALTHCHARGVRVSREIICLMENGFADGALARWRSLHELNVVSTFIRNNDETTSLRFLASRDCKSYKAAREYSKYESRAGFQSFGDEEVEGLRVLSELRQKQFGDEIINDWGWAHGPLKAKRPTFFQLEENCGLDHWRPRFRWSSHEIHGGHIPADTGLGVSEAEQPVHLVGQSNSGMTDPAHMTAISITGITTNLLMIEANLDRVVFQRCLSLFCDSVGEMFLVGDAKTKFANAPE